MIKPTKYFPFDLERFRKGEKAVTYNNQTQLLKKVVFTSYHAGQPFPLQCGHESYTDTGVIVGGRRRIFMLSPDPSTIPPGARERFEAGEKWSITLGEYSNQYFRYRHSIENIEYHDDRFHCHVDEIKDWGFLCKVYLFDEPFYKWVEFKDITFID